ncbi:MAG: SDR family oxidoreductase [Pyrinomonadaceae bacterium]|nr:SDR family oxidoreductase [Pyrinomonadaceae bacterium]
MKVLVLGGTGMLGHKLVQRLKERFSVSTTVRELADDVPYKELFDGAKVIRDVDATDFSAIERSIDEIAPEVVINAIGVIKQLAGAKDVIQSLTLNSLLPQRLADLAPARGFRLIHVSTDCVFDGEKGNYSESDIPNALDLYGQSKRWGEVVGPQCLTLRTSIIGRELGTSHSLVDWFLSNRGGTVKGYKNAIYSGFPTTVVTDIIGDLIQHHPDLYGLYQVSSRPINKLELLELINSSFNADIDIEPFEEFHIDRSLDGSRFEMETGFSPPSWDEMIEKMAADPTPYDEWKQ